mmetsp:Transcript_8810/g.6550  ORF Transcript_8810/g.6550 Transcript_8810/m.6550 type:complete len:80 (+) Transcript_8810:462-701(+)
MQKQIDQSVDYSRMKGAVFKSKLLNPQKVRGLGSMGASFGLYYYLPYLVPWFGSTLPMLSVIVSAFYGFYALGQSDIVN